MVGQNTIKGRIQAVSESVTKTGKQRYGYKIHETWYDGFGTPKYDKDENVELTYKDNTVGDRTFHNIIGVVSLDKPSKPKVVDAGEVKPAKEKPEEPEEDLRGSHIKLFQDCFDDAQTTLEYFVSKTKDENYNSIRSRVACELFRKRASHWFFQQSEADESSKPDNKKKSE